MILAAFFKSADGQIRRIEISGHAGADEIGKDLVCAAASAILYTALGAIEEICGLTDFYRIVEDMDSDSIPFSEIWIPNQIDSIETEKAVQIILRTMQVGYKQLEETTCTDGNNRFVEVKEFEHNQEV